MPRYTYRCKSCSVIYNITHSMSERLTVCQSCNAEGLIRVPSSFTSDTSFDENNIREQLKPGSLVEDYIDTAKEEIERSKEEMTKDLEL